MFKRKKEMRRRNLENIHLLWPTNKKITNLFKHTNKGIAFRNTNTLQQFTKPKTQYQTTEHNKSWVYKLTRNTCHRSYIRQTSCSLKLKFQEHTRYIIHNEPQPVYALHILNCKHEYSTAPLRTPWHYSNISTNHHFSYHRNSCTYNYSIISINSSQITTLMNKILCSNYFTTDILHHTPPDISINTSLNLVQPASFHPAYQTVSYTDTSADISTMLLLHFP